MLDFADVVAVNKFERRGGADAVRDGGQAARPQPGGVRAPRRPTCRCSAPAPRRFNDDRRDGAVPVPRGRAARARACRWPRGSCPPVTGKTSAEAASVIPAGPVGLPRRDRRHRPRATTRTTDEQAAAVRRVQRLAAVRAELDGQPARAVADLEAQAARNVVGRQPGAHRPAGPRWSSSYSGDEQVVRVRDRELRTKLTRRVAVRQHDPAGGAAALRGPRGAAAVPAQGEPARLLPVHRRGVPVQAGGGGPGADVRRRGRSVPHQPPVQAAVGRQRGDPAVHRVRLGHPLRPRSR